MGMATKAVVGILIGLARPVRAKVQDPRPLPALQAVSASSEPAAQQSGIGVPDAQGRSSGSGEAHRRGALAGTVVSVDASAKKIVLKDGKGALHEFSISHNCRIMKKGKKTLESIQPEQRVVLNYDGNMAKVIHVEESKAKKK